MNERRPAHEQEKDLSRRPASPADTEFAREVHHRAYRDVIVRQFGGWDDRQQDAFFEDNWKSGEDFEILSCGGEACGYYQEWDHPDFIEPRELVLSPEFQGKGIGSAILKEAIARARERGVPVKIKALRENRALDLYHRLGFRDTGGDATHIELEFDPRNE